MAAGMEILGVTTAATTGAVAGTDLGAGTTTVGATIMVTPMATTTDIGTATMMA